MTLNLPTYKIMGILNITPDSFHPGSRFYGNVDLARKEALQMVAAGADIIDIGGESTRPGATPVSVAEELNRVIPVVECLAKETDALLSVDTSDPTVMSEAIKAGARMINDVRALTRPGALEVVAAEPGISVCLMHMQGEPTTMQANPTYRDVLAQVYEFLEERMKVCAAAGIERNRITIDPGFGFGKTRVQNFTLLQQLDKLQALGCPVLVGLSRKASIGEVLDAPVAERLYGSLALTALAVVKGARIFRTHDVKATRDVVRIVTSVLQTNDKVDLQ
jgi:dihydropteroate synthase